ncbi:MAG: lytic transglycosylase domain-containing protein, partial [Gemmatimonadaceae bacterium]
AARGMPRELVYLPMIESEYKPRAKSPASAVGLWQFMSGTARHLGLTVTRHTDERTSPSKSTDAALTYLDELHDKFGSWYLAAAAYNAGPGTVSKALKRVTHRTRGTDADFYRIAPHLPRETREYVPKLVAAARIGQHAGKYGFGD